MKKLEGEMIKWGKLLFDRHLISGWGGNLSCRVRENEFLITGRHAPLGFLTAADLVRIDGAGRPLNRDQLASSETPLHLAVYAAHGTQAIVHVHPPMSTGIFIDPRSFRSGEFRGEVYNWRSSDSRPGYADGNKAREVSRRIKVPSGRHHQGSWHGGYRQEFSRGLFAYRFTGRSCALPVFHGASK